MDVDTSGWSGDGSFTELLVGALRRVPEVAALRVEDAPASRNDAGYNFIANELFVTFATGVASERARFLGIVPYSRTRAIPLLDLDRLASIFTGLPEIGEPDYSDSGMIQYLRTERVVAPYQTRGVKVIELVRIYQSGARPR
jgi:hypothetical protein